eukprot:TRINITY_DN4227_c0_g1_i2.p4 TRINITY_DN4227_c0_g1~~TRINITY_DN4227_c0_g1_i2.p4  ORF type:complete len:170 (+),score=21.02 TRINITY_DN4227_c0_g1_i2:79-588(+)
MSDNAVARTVFVSGIDAELGRAQVEAFLRRHGRVVRRKECHRDCGRDAWSGLFEFASAAEARSLLAADGWPLGRSAVRCFSARHPVRAPDPAAPPAAPPPPPRSRTRRGLRPPAPPATAAWRRSGGQGDGWRAVRAGRSGHPRRGLGGAGPVRRSARARGDGGKAGAAA